MGIAYHQPRMGQTRSHHCWGIIRVPVNSTLRRSNSCSHSGCSYPTKNLPVASQSPYDSLLDESHSPWNAGCRSPRRAPCRQGYKGTAIVEICTEPGEAYLLSGCGAKRCVAPEAKAMKYYKLEVPGKRGDCRVSERRSAKNRSCPWENGFQMVFFLPDIQGLQEDMFNMEDNLEISMFGNTYLKTYSNQILFNSVSQITSK